MKLGRHLLLSLCVVGLLAFGCKESTSTAETKPIGDQKAGSTATAEKSGDAGTATSSKPQDAIAALPAEVRTEAFEYYGLGRTAPSNYTFNTDGKSSEGGLESSLMSSTASEAKFKVTNTGRLDVLGEMIIVSNKDGVFVESINGEKLAKPQLELPSDLSPGKTWKQDATVNSPQGEIKQNTTLKIVGVEKLDWNGSKVDALRVSGSGIVEGSGVKQQTSLVGWYVKGKGVVKIELEQKDSKGKVSKVVQTMKGE